MSDGRGKGERGRPYAKFRVVENCFLIVFLLIVREVVNGDTIILDILHHLHRQNRSSAAKSDF
jgi:hypothetical protein